MLFWEIIFWVSLFMLLHAYIFYPLLLQLMSVGKTLNKDVYSEKDDLPEVAILLSVYNEEEMIADKIESTFNTHYPVSKIKLIIGSDNSTDKTNDIIKKFQNIYSQIVLNVFEERLGKSKVINYCSNLAFEPIIIQTDANVLFEKNTIYQLVKHFKNPDIGLVAGNIINSTHKKSGISFQEKTYLNYEKKIKFNEGILMGAMIGAFGGCYAIRKKYFIQVPDNFLMDDFYVSMNVLKMRSKSIKELQALCFEDVSNKITEEFRRKMRIAAGNFQNLIAYRDLLWPPFSKTAFSFFSHKIIRWIGPFLLIFLFISSGILSKISSIYLLFFIIQLIFLISVLLDLLLKSLNIHVKLLRFATHFYLMNLALLAGFVKFLMGVKSNIWEPTVRNQ